MVVGRSGSGWGRARKCPVHTNPLCIVLGWKFQNMAHGPPCMSLILLTLACFVVSRLFVLFTRKCSPRPMTCSCWAVLFVLGRAFHDEFGLGPAHNHLYQHGSIQESWWTSTTFTKHTNESTILTFEYSLVLSASYLYNLREAGSHVV